MTISFSLSVNKDNISKFNLGVKSGAGYISPLDEIILILKLKNGPDHYITLEGNFNYSSFGMPTDVLCNARFSNTAIASLRFPDDYNKINDIGMV